VAGESLVEMLEREARTAAESLPPEAHDYIATGSGEEISLAEATDAWRSFRLRPHVLRDVSSVSTATGLFDVQLHAPILVGATAYQMLAHRDGELETARGVNAAGALMVLSTRLSRRIEDVAQTLTGPWWFQVYVMRDRDLTRELVLRAAAAGAGALVLTGDTPFLGRKPRLPRLPITDEQYLVNLRDHIGDSVDVDDATTEDASITFDTIAWLREMSGLPVLVKGVLRGDDALECVDAGAAGVIVSNHGARQLDRSVASAIALEEVVGAVGGRVPVLVDGGVRSGVDVLIALALGATATLVGRPVLWALAADGARGVAAMLDAMREDLAHAMGLAGVTRVDEIGRDLLA
jgi:4-hydroxymandelate oxidase